MVRPITIAPSILSADFTRLGEQVAAAEAAGADMIHVDVMDGHFVPNITMGPLVVRALRRVTALPLDVHLMVEQPERHVEAFAEAGASALTVHIEASPHLHRTLQHIRALGCRAGVSLNPHTPAMMIDGVWGLLDLVLVMTVNPGFGGQRFLPEVLPKIAEVRARIDARQLHIDLAVDGGIEPEQTAGLAMEAGANLLIAGEAIFGAPAGIAAAIRAFRAAAAQATDNK